MEKEYMTIEQVAKFTTISVPMVKKYLRENKIPSYKVGKRRVFEKSEIISWMEAQKSK